LSARILRLPADGQDLLLPNDEVGLAPYVYALGVRNTFDLAWNAAGDLFGAENSGDRDDPDELNWIREGGHYGFPWRMGTNDTPQQFPGYVPDADPLVDRRYGAYTQGLFYDDPDYPPRPPVTFLDPIPNVGPDADSFRDPETRAVVKGSEVGGALATFTAHRAPSGLVFDVENALPGRFRGGGFVVGFTRGDPTGDMETGPFRDASEDLLFLDLTRTTDGYRVGATSIVCGFANPLDAELRDGRLYVLEFPTGNVYEVTLPGELPVSCAPVPR
jgi:glucose/arabinose dehydrogenase